jgi:hypothetical protein
MRIQVRKNSGPQRACIIASVNARASSRPCGTRRSPCRSRRRGTQANADVAGFARSAPGAKFFSAGIPRVDAWSFYHVIEMWSSVFLTAILMPMSQLGPRAYGRSPQCAIGLDQVSYLGGFCHGRARRAQLRTTRRTALWRWPQGQQPFSTAGGTICHRIRASLSPTSGYPRTSRASPVLVFASAQTD